MKYIRFKDKKNSAARQGQVVGDKVEILEGCIFKGDLRPTGESLPLGSITNYLPPVDPPNIIAIGANYVDHCRESGKQPPKLPLMFVKTTNTLIAHGDEIVLPRANPDEVDYEAELAVVIGKKASYVKEEDAMKYVLGFTCANDVSARDVQLRIDLQWARGKSFDTFCPLGPFLVTDVGDPGDIHIRMRLNGEVMQDQPVSDMIFTISRIISHITAGITLVPGTVILTGTPSGVGMGRDPKRFLKPGDVTEVDIDRVGVLRNKVVAPR